MLGRRNLREAVALALGLNLEEGDERPHLLLHRLEPDEGVELGLKLGHRPGRLRPPARLEVRPRARTKSPVSLKKR